MSLGTLSLDGTKLAGNAAQKGKPDGAADRERSWPRRLKPAPPGQPAARGRRPGGHWPAVTRSEPSRKPGTRPQQPGNGAGAEPPRADRAGAGRGRTPPARDVRVMRNQKGYVAGYSGQLVVTDGDVIVGAMLSRHPVGRTPPRPLRGT